MSSKNVKDFASVNILNLNSDSILSVSSNELKRLNGANSTLLISNISGQNISGHNLYVTNFSGTVLANQISNSTSAGRALLTGSSVQSQRETLSFFPSYSNFPDLVANGPQQVQRAYTTTDYWKIYTWVPSLAEYKEIAGTNTYPAFSVTNINNPAGRINAGSTITYNTIISNRGSTINTGNGIFTAPISGFYNVSFDGITDSAVSPPHEVLLFKNTSTYTNVRAYGGYNGYQSIGFKTIINLNTNETLNLYINAGAIHNNAASVFSVNFLG